MNSTCEWHPSTQDGLDPGTKFRYEVLLEPRVLFEPDVVSRTGVGQRHRVGPHRFPSLDGLSQILVGQVTQVPDFCVLADHEREGNMRQMLQQLLSPSGCTLRPWRKVARLACAGVTKTHGNNGNFRLVVEHRSVNAHPLPKAIATRVIKGHARFMNPETGSLPDDQYFCLRIGL